MINSKSMMSFLMSFILLITILPSFSFILMNNKIILLKWEMVTMMSQNIELQVILDMVSLSFCLLITLIFTAVMIFSLYYMKMELNKKRFNWLVILFVISMMMLIFIPNLITLLLGWDGLGITSFCLVIFYQNYKSLMAGMITAMMNRMGDAAIIMAIAYMSMNSQWSIFLNWTKMNWILMLLLILAAMTKSAQIPFSSWLPAAMAAPTPVSALVHSSTLVTAGVFLMIRFFPFISSFKSFSSIMLFIGSSTMIMASLAAMKENDMKKIIALSTLSQLGIMFMALSIKLPSLALLHLYTHAMFKALLFILSGIMIHMNSGNQDIRTFGHMYKTNISLIMTFNISNLALCGMPFLAGFYSKENIINMVMNSSLNTIGVMLIIMSIPLTILYSMRLTYLLLINKKTNKFNSIIPVSSQPFFLFNSFYLLMTMVIMSGALFIWMMTPIFNMPLIMKIPSLIPIMIMIITLMLSITMMLKKNMIKITNLTDKMNISMWFLNFNSLYPITNSFFYMSYLINKATDKGWLELIGPQGIYLSAKSSNAAIKKFMYTTITATLILTLLLFIYLIM